MKRGRIRRRAGTSRRDISCLEARPLLSALLDGEADDLQRVRVDRHLRTCARCRDFRQVSAHARVLARRQGAIVRAVDGEECSRTAARLAATVRASGAGRRRSGSWRSVIAGATLVGVLTLGAVLGGLGVWTLSQETAETRAWVRDPVSLPQVVALRTLDPDAIVKEPVSILAAWAPPRSSENTFDEKAMFWATPMSHFESVHFRPERL